ncbi:MAG: hypothetical protein LBK95_06950, partial [Bifidobacteriaceae bacterium]|nr:hypothetical protein [Bifidobacteriaceae bacterium]
MSETEDTQPERVDPRTKPHAVIHQGIPAEALRPATGSVPTTTHPRSGQYPASGQYPKSGQFPRSSQYPRSSEAPRRLIRTGPPYSASDAATAGGAIRR